jgi:type II secretory pathway component PulC
VSVLASWIVLASGCGAPRSAAEQTFVEVERPEPPPAPPSTEGTIARAELDAVLAAGLGRFLQRIETEAHVDAGRFVGHRVRALSDGVFAGVDLQPGDTIVSVNGLPIERPEQAMAAWDALRVASELTIEYLRDGEARQLRFAIAE